MQEMQEMCVRSLGGEDPLEEEMATHTSILTWAIPWTEELQSTGSQRLRHNWMTEHIPWTPPGAFLKGCLNGLDMDSGPRCIPSDRYSGVAITAIILWLSHSRKLSHSMNWSVDFPKRKLLRWEEKEWMCRSSPVLLPVNQLLSLQYPYASMLLWYHDG